LKDLPFTKFCGEQQATCTETCNAKIKEFVCNAITGITTTPCTCEDGEVSDTVDPPSIPLPPSTDGLEGVEDTAAAVGAGEPASSPAPDAAASSPAATPAAPASSAARTAGSVVALGFVAAAMLF
jgi:hypothetical protein